MMKKCPNCGAEGREEENFCKECGEKLSQEPKGEAKNRIENLENQLQQMNLKISNLKPVKVPENLDKRIESLEERDQGEVKKEEMKLVIKKIDGMQKSIDSLMSKPVPSGDIGDIDSLVEKKTDQIRRQILDSVKHNSHEISALKKKLKEMDKVKTKVTSLHKNVQSLSTTGAGQAPVSADGPSRDEFSALKGQVRESLSKLDSLEISTDDVRQDLKEDISTIIGQIDALRKKINAKKPIEAPATKQELNSHRDQIADIKKTIQKIDKEYIKQINQLSKEVASLSRDIGTISKPFKGMGPEDLKKIFGKLDMPSKEDIRSLIKEIETNKNEMESIRESMPAMPSLKKGDVEDLQTAVTREFEAINATIRELTQKQEAMLEKKDLEIKALKDDIRSMVMLNDEIKSLKVTDLLREFQAIKQKMAFIEESLDKVDLEPIQDKIHQFEAAIRNMKVESPYILE